MKRKLMLALVFTATALAAFSQAFTCDGSFYVIMRDNGRSFLQNIRHGNNPENKEIPLNDPGRRYTCLGMSIVDLHLYALDFDTKELLRIDAAGRVTSLGIPENLDLNLEYWAGDVAPEGRRLVVIGRNKTTGVDTRVFSITLDSPNHYAGSSGIISDVPTAITDIATDPIRGITYGFDKTNRQVVVLNVNQVTHHLHIAIEPVMESLFFDKNGHLFGYGATGNQQEQSILFALDKIKGGATVAESYRTGTFGDGCSCPYTMSFFRSVQPEVLAPCSEFTIEYTIINQAGIGKTGVLFEDVLPQPFTITEVTEHTWTLAEVDSGPGGNIFLIENLDILIGYNTIRIKGYLNDTGESFFETQASLENLPLGLAGLLESDDPATPAPFDPNFNNILQSDGIELEDYIRFNCAKDTAVLSLPFQADHYLWSDGSSGPTLNLAGPGLYWVQAANDCITAKDSIQVGPFPDPLSVELGPLVRIKEGSVVHLAFQTNAGSVRQLNWSSSGPFDLSCMDCPDPFAVAVYDNTYFLQLTDQNGCRAQDSITMEVLPFRYIYAANVFSPNGDGINDVFYLQGIDQIAEVGYLRVFDRWGNLLFESGGGAVNHPDHGWNGRLNGGPVAPGVYVWSAQLKFLDGEKALLSGEVAVIKD